MQKFYTMNDVRRANAARGHHFFEAGSMRFFDSRIGRELFGHRYFVTSEQFHGSQGSAPRRYTVREVRSDGSIETVGEFGAYETSAQARRAIEKMLAHDAELAAQAADDRAFFAAKGE